MQMCDEADDEAAGVRLKPFGTEARTLGIEGGFSDLGRSDWRRATSQTKDLDIREFEEADVEAFRNGRPISKRWWSRKSIIICGES